MTYLCPMELTEILGWIATGLILISFLVKDMYQLRILNAWGATTWLVYGFLRFDKPLIFVNLCVLVIHSIWFYNYKKTKKRV